MTHEDRLLLRNLLDRLDADAAAERPVLRGHVSDRERKALRSLLEYVEDAAPSLQTDHAPEPVRRVATASEFEINTAALQFEAPQNPDWTLCLDFGTAKSKAFAANDADPPKLEPLPIGKADQDRDGAVYDVSSSVWIADDGLVFLGSEAVNRGMLYGDSSNRSRLDSLKQEISQVSPQDGAAWARRKLPPKFDPTETLTYYDAITIYLAYLTDLATTALEGFSLSRYVGRRFTVPWWPEEQRRWAGDLLATTLGRAQLLADTFRGRWREGIPVHDVKRAVDAAAAHDAAMRWILADGSREGILEALAAASARLWTDQTARDVMLVVDVGAGTTDISLFCVVQRDGESHRSFPIVPCGVAIRQGGDTLDSLLVAEVMRRAAPGEDSDLRQRMSADLNRQRRQLKEGLFKTGRITARLVNDDTVTITEDEFMELDGIRRFESGIVDKIQGFLQEVHESWAKAVRNHMTLVLTGGGCDLPMVRDLRNRSWMLGKKNVSCRLAPKIPRFEDYPLTPDFIQEYPRLAVSMGGALTMRLDEKEAQPEFMGGAPPPGRLDSFPTKGI